MGDELTRDQVKRDDFDKLKAMRKPESWPTDVLYWDPAT